MECKFGMHLKGVATSAEEVRVLEFLFRGKITLSMQRTSMVYIGQFREFNVCESGWYIVKLNKY